MKRPFMLMILDGFGLSEKKRGNAIYAARKPNLDKIFARYPHTSLNASGLAVGLPDGQMGNSEVGHLNIGAGRVVYQELTRITRAIDEGRLEENTALISAMDSASCKDAALHIMGLLSDGGVHSHIDHIKAVISMAVSRKVPRIYIHCFTDGRDVPPTSGAGYAADIEKFTKSLSGKGCLLQLATVSGRYYAMDRDKRWERVRPAYEAIVTGISGSENLRADSLSGAIKAAYERGETDEFIRPSVCGGYRGAKDGDSFIFCNFRPDRAREMTRCFVDPESVGFRIKEPVRPSVYVCMTQYDGAMPNVLTAFPPAEIKNTLGEYLSSLGLSQLRIAETEKYAHVTFFFNGGKEVPYPHEDRILIPSPKVATYDMKPEMSAFEVTDAAVEKIRSGAYDCIILNFANADMVGHTGIFDAAVKAVEAVDECVGRITSAVLAAGGQILLTADHGNADDMIDEDGSPVTAHSTNPVPLVHIAKDPASKLKDGGSLCDIAPTMLKLMGLSIPPEMTGKPLF